MSNEHQVPADLTRKKKRQRSPSDKKLGGPTASLDMGQTETLHSAGNQNQIDLSPTASFDMGQRETLHFVGNQNQIDLSPSLSPCSDRYSSFIGVNPINQEKDIPQEQE